MKFSLITKSLLRVCAVGTAFFVLYETNAANQPKKIVKKVKGGTITLTPVGKQLPPARQKTLSEKERWAFLPDVVAVVGDKKITKNEFLKDFKQQIPENRIKMMPVARLKVLAKRFAGDMVDKCIFLKLAESDKIIPSAELVTTEFNKIVKKMSPAQLAAFKKDLQKKKTTIDAEIKRISQDKAAQKNIAINLWFEKHIAPKVKVTQADIEKFYKANEKSFKTPEKVQASHILIKPKKQNDAAADKAAKEKAEKVLAKLKKGGDFAKLAKEYSDCPSAKRGGDLGEFDRTRMVKPFSDAAFALPVGKISGIVKTRFGYHIIKVTKHIKAGTVPLAQAAPYIKNFLKRQKQFMETQKILKAEKKKLHVKINV